MFNTIKKEFYWDGKKVELETGKIARQANAAVMVKMGDTAILCTVVGKKEASKDVDFLPLIVNYQERFYADAKFPGGFIKRESKPSEREVLISRLIDRSLRPLFPENFFNEVQVICTVLSYDANCCSTSVLGLLAASTALIMSDIPFTNTFAAIKIGLKDGEFLLNPSLEELESSELDLVLAATNDSVLMVESEAKELDETTMLSAIKFAHDNIRPVINFINEFASLSKRPKWDHKKKDLSSLYNRLEEEISSDIIDVYNELDKQLRTEKLTKLKEEVSNKLLCEDENLNKTDIAVAFYKLQKNIVRKRMLESNKRIDGRSSTEIRNIECETSLLNKSHGSALFTRGSTQVLAATTLGTAQDEQLVDDLIGVRSQRFMLHYNFPPFSVGEISLLRPPGRREIGHGKLAHKAIDCILPDKSEFPYSIRVVAEVTESNGSSSMATVCSTILSLMDTGVPIKAPVAGITMGLIKEGEEVMILSDIMGDEDFLGDMDFKVAGTKKGITALQMDIKIDGISQDILQKALEQAKEGRAHILQKMLNTLPDSREKLNENAPRINTIQVDKDNIRDIIGTGGKVIREICERSEAKIDIDDDGKVSIYANNQDSLDIACNMIHEIVSDPEIGEIYNGIITKITDFGIFVKFFGNTEGLVHISEMVSKRIKDLKELFSEGEEVSVKMLNRDRMGKVKLTMKSITQPDNITEKPLWQKLN